MSKDARTRIVLTEDARRKVQEAVDALSACGFGPDGPRLETTFAEIEDFGHEVGRMLARQIEAKLATQQADLFPKQADCPTCGTTCGCKTDLSTRDVQTIDGVIPLSEPTFHCPACRRDFFPSAYLAAD